MKRDFAALNNQQFDLLVCGGGIYGAWTAYDAALRGLKVAIVEQGDWAGATSSASSKLIHGGLRYLESYDFKLVKKALAERQLLLRIAPHRVWPLRFGVPVYAESRISRLQLKLGLMLYDFFASGFFTLAAPLKKMMHRYFNRAAFSRHFPVLDTMGLRGGFTYSDAQTDDARLVLELIDGAMQAGAVCVNYCLLDCLKETGGQAGGAVLQDQLGNGRVDVSAKTIVYATGQWSTELQEGKTWCRVTKGIHLVLPAMHVDEALLLTAPADGRVFFVIPWYGQTLIGTTDTDYTGDIRQVKVEESEVAYLLDAVNHYLKSPWQRADVLGSFAGLRVMKRSELASPSAVSRDWELKTAANGVHYSIGGKITSSREDAASIVDTVCVQLGSQAACASNGRLLPWAPQEDYAHWFAATFRHAHELHIDHESATWLIRRHGSRVADIFGEIERDPLLAERIAPSVPLIQADMLYCARHEMVVHLADLLRRRMPLLLLAKLNAGELRHLALRVAGCMGWDEEAVEREVISCMAAQQ